MELCVLCTLPTYLSIYYYKHHKISCERDVELIQNKNYLFKLMKN